MKRGNEFSIENLFGKAANQENRIPNISSNINYLIQILGKHIERFEEAYKKRDPREFNLLKKQILEVQRRIHSLL